MVALKPQFFRKKNYGKIGGLMEIMITVTGDMFNRLSTRSILDGYKLILTSLLVLMGISTNQQRIIFFAGYLR